MLLRRIRRLAGSRTTRPRFKTPGGALALILFLLAALLSLWGNGSGEVPPAPSRPMPRPSAPPAPTPVEPPPVFAPEEPEKEVDGCPEGCEERLPGCDIKGNTSYRTGERIYHLPGQQFYGRTVIDPGQGERWFCSEEEAVANGWRKAKR